MGKGKKKKSRTKPQLSMLSEYLQSLHMIDFELLEKVSALQELGTMQKTRQSIVSHANCRNLHQLQFSYLTRTSTGNSTN